MPKSDVDALEYLEVARWSGTFIGIIAALLIASNIEASKYGFSLFVVSGILWGIVAYSIKDYALLLLQVVFVVIDIYGMYRWLI
jgi:nicotinamide riboside transporter PnuC